MTASSRDLLGYAGSPPDPRWPGGARVAVSVVVNFEEGAEYSIADGDGENEAVYEIEQRIVGRPDPAVDSHFEYGSRAGWWRIMDVLRGHGARATVSAAGRAVERLPNGDQLFDRNYIAAGASSRVEDALPN